MAFPRPTFASTSSTPSASTSASASAATRNTRAPAPAPKRRVHFNESPLMYTYTPPATPTVTPRTPPWSPPTNDNDAEDDDGEEEEEEEETDEDTDEGPCTPPSNTGLGFPPTPMHLPKLPSPYSAGGSVGRSSLYDSPSPKTSPQTQTHTGMSATPHPHPTPTPSRLLFDPSTMKSQLMWDVTTPPTSARARVPHNHNLNNLNLDPSRARARARLLPRMHLGKGKDSSFPHSNANASVPGELESETPPLSQSQSLLQNAATLPGLSSLEVHIPQLPPFWKPIQLRARASASKTKANTVTISDLLTALHKYLQTPITQREFNILPESVQKSVARAYWRRYDAAVVAATTATISASSPSATGGGPGASEAERIKKTGVCRVDALAGNTQFVAFVPVVSAPSTCAWQVILAAAPPAPAPTPAPASKR